jgi:hypothetical protein
MYSVVAIHFFLIRIVGGGGGELGPIDTSATEWPIVPAPGDCGEFGGMKIGRGNKVLGANMPERHFVHHKSYLPDPGSNPDRHGGKPATNHLSYGAAFAINFDLGDCSIGLHVLPHRRRGNHY